MSDALEMLRSLNNRWQPFAEQNGEDAGRIRDLALAICEQMTGRHTTNQIELMQQASEFEPFRALMRVHKDALVVDADSDRDLAIWIRAICYCATMHAESYSA